MLTPLRYQFSNHDCGTAIMENALSYMIPRQHFPPDLLHYVYNFLLDGYTKRGWGFYGTNHESLCFFASWLQAYFDQWKQFKMHVEFYRNETVTVDFIKDMFKKNAKKKICLVVYNYDTWGHYILITGFTKDGDIKAWDPDFRNRLSPKDTPFTIVTDHPCEYNRIIPASSLDSTDTNVTFALGPFEERDAFFLIKDSISRKK